MKFKEALETRFVFFDGATGTMLQQLNAIKPGDSPERLNITRKDAVINVHRQYIDAGSDVITTNTLGAYAHKYDNDIELITAAVDNARTAAAGREVYVAFDMGPTGRLFQPMGDLGFEEGYSLFARAARAGAECGADLILIETMTDLYETKAAVLAAKETGLPVVVTVTFDDRGRTLTGADPLCMAALLEGLGVDALGMNCGFGPTLYQKLLPPLLHVTSLPVIIQPNAGLPVMIDDIAHYDLSPDDFAGSMADMGKEGARILGGCCGTTPLHIQKMIAACQGLPPIPVRKKDIMMVSSGTKAVAFTKTANGFVQSDGQPLVIAQCISADIDDLIDEAMEMAAEADVLEIAVDSPETVISVQELIRVPLSLRAPSADILIESVRVYNGRPMVTGLTDEMLSSAHNGKTPAGSRTVKEMLEAYGAVII